MGDFWSDAGDNVTAFLGGTTPERVRASKNRVSSFAAAGKPAPSIQRDKNAFAPNPYKNQPSGIPQSDTLPRNTAAPRSVNQEMYNPNGTRQGADDNIVPQPHQQSILDQLYQQMTTPYKRPDASQYDFSPIDNALKGRLDLIDQLKNTTQGNFQKSDQATQDMHNQFVNQMNTEGVAGVNKIADTQKSNLTNDNNAAIAQLNAQKAADMSARTEMLNRLGIQGAGGAVDPNTATMDQGISTIAQRGAADQTMADNNRASNMQYNTVQANAMGAAGIQRREQLANQLQAILGKADMAKTDAQTQAAQQKAGMLNDSQGVSFQAYKDQQSRAQNLFDTLLRDQTQNNRYNMQYGPGSKYQQGASGTGGYQQIADDLSSTPGMDPDQAAHGMAALDDVLSNGNYLAGAQGQAGTDPYDRTAVLAKALMDKDHSLSRGVATQIATNYGKISTLK